MAKIIDLSMAFFRILPLLARFSKSMHSATIVRLLLVLFIVSGLLACGGQTVKQIEKDAFLFAIDEIEKLPSDNPDGTQNKLVISAKLGVILAKKAMELHEMGVDQEIADAIHEIISEAHEVVDVHHEEGMRYREAPPPKRSQ